MTAYRTLAIAGCLVIGWGQPVPASTQPPAQPVTKPPTKITPPIRPRTTCPNDLQDLAKALLRDLPEYINRLNHQSGGSLKNRYAIAASTADTAPLPVVSSGHLDVKSGGLEQVFFTVLEREYDSRVKTEYQHYHWLFLAHTDKTGWQLATLYSRLGAYPAEPIPPSALRETTREITGRAIRLWLRDCKAGAIPIP